jgi:GNAT superfamily N-acetyltransferase
MQELAQRVFAVRPELVNGDANVGELAWGWGKGYDPLRECWRHRMWFVDGELAGWGWAYLPHRVVRADGTVREVEEARLVWQAHPDRPELLGEILDWYDGVAGDADRLLTVQSGDARSREAVAAHGYAFDTNAGSDDGDWHQFNVRELDEVPDPVLPEGFRFLSAGDVSVADAVAAHRAAWPGSSFTEQALERLRRTWPYRPDLHVLVAAPDGTLAANAIMWLDDANRAAEFEPVGTHRDFRRRGLGAALLLHGMRVARAAGAERMLVACLGAPTRPAARELYYSVGFREFTRDLPQIKTGQVP